ncbi:MAG: glycoside hydrolase family 28 protein [Acidisphaera sp.]|nr:glycoside hydrolase family 28 protein [Acidisphaera sp.]
MIPHRAAALGRRALLAGTAASSALIGLQRRSWGQSLPLLDPQLFGDPWAQAAAIVERLALVEAELEALLRGREVLRVTDFGAQPCQLTQVPIYTSATTLGQGPGPVPGAFDNYPAFAAAIAAAHRSGGRKVVVPAGNWYCAGPITLMTNVHFHLASGAQIWFSPNPADYAKYGPYNFGPNGNLVQSRWQGNDCYNFSSMVYAAGQHDFALTGEDQTSILNGQAGTPYDGTHCWWTWKGTNGQYGFTTGAPAEGTPNPLNGPIGPLAPSLSTAEIDLIEYGTSAPSTKYTADASYLPALSEAGVPLSERVFGLGHQLPPAMIEFLQCRRVVLRGYQVTNTPFWQHHPIACRHVVIRNVYANSVGPNNDGFDPEACDHVVADGVTFNTGDDCIAIKSGKDNDTEFGPAQNHVIRYCTMNSGHGGITLGSEITAGVRNIYAHDLQMLNQNYATNPLNIAIRIKTNLNRGGTFDNFHVKNVTLPNGINLTPSFYTPLPGSPIPAKTVSTNQGGIITFDCDYSPGSDNVRIRPPVVQNVTIANVTASAPPGQSVSCYQAIIIQGPVASDYDGLTQPPPTVLPVENVTIRDCNFGTPAAPQPYYLYNVQDLVLKNVVIAGVTYNTTLSA